MKKILATLMVASMLLALASCGDEGDTATSSAAPATTAPVISATPAPTPADVISIEPVATPTPEPAGPANIALAGTATDCGVDAYDGVQTSDRLIDGDTMAANGWQPQTWNEGDWAAITFEEAADVDLIVIYAESGYFGAYEDGGYALYYQEEGSDKWNELKDISVERVVDEASDPKCLTDTVTLDEKVNMAAIKIELLGGGIDDHKYAPKIAEIEVYAAAAEETPAEETPAEEAAE